MSSDDLGTPAGCSRSTGNIDIVDGKPVAKVTTFGMVGTGLGNHRPESGPEGASPCLKRGRE